MTRYLFALVFGVAACSPRHALDQSPAVDGHDAASPPTSQPDADPPAPAASCGATCATPAGAVEPLTSMQQALAAVTGRWLFCSGQSAWAKVGAPSDAVGVEYDTKGFMTYLVAGPAGPVRGTTQAHQLTFELVPSGAGRYQINMYKADKAGNFAVFRYSPCPRELDFVVAYDSTPSILVPAESSGAGAPSVPQEPEAPPVDPMCTVACDPALFPVTQTQSLAEAAALLRGRWRFCADRQRWLDRNMPADVVAIEFGEASGRPDRMELGGNAYYLVDGPQGPVRGQGFDYQLRYSISPDGPRFYYGIGNRRTEGQGRIDVTACPAMIGLWGDLGSTLLRF